MDDKLPTCFFIPVLVLLLLTTVIIQHIEQVQIVSRNSLFILYLFIFKNYEQYLRELWVIYGCILSIVLTSHSSKI